MADALHAASPPGGGIGDDIWSSGYLPYPTPSNLTRVEAALLLIRVGPLVGLVLSFCVGWLQHICTATLAWIVWPLTGRPLQQLGSMCQSVWSGDMGKYSGILVYIYVLLLFLWWLTPHSASAKVGLLSLTAMPCFTASLYYGLQGAASTASRTLNLTLNSVIHPLTGGTLKGAKNLWKHRRPGHTVSDCTTQGKAFQISPASSKSSPEKHTRSKFHLSGESHHTDSGGDGSNASGSVFRKSAAFLDASRGFLVGTFQWSWWLLKGFLSIPSQIPRLEAVGKAESDIYHGVEKCYCNVLRQNNTKAALMTKLPWKSFSKLWGYLHNLYLPYFLRFIGLNFYSWLFSVDLDEAEEPCLLKYKNLSQLFRRNLRPGLRPIDSEHILTSPADGKVLYLSRVQDGVLEQVKGVSYSVRGFLGPPNGIHKSLDKMASVRSLDDLTDTEYVDGLVTREGNALYQCIIYLAPGDYHHFHSPTDWTVSMRRHIPGELFSVNPGMARWLQGLFSFNERAVYTGTWEHGFFSFTAVGATNVGSIVVDFDKDLITNVTTPYERDSFFDCRFDSDDNDKVNAIKGEHFGQFHLGSTIVLLFEAPKDFTFAAVPGQKLRYGQPLGGVPRRNNTAATNTNGLLS